MALCCQPFGFTAGQGVSFSGSCDGINASRLLDFQKAPGVWPGIQTTAIATNGSVVWSGTLKQPGLSELPLRDWQYPTNLIYDPLVSLTAIRGVTPK